VTTQPRKDLVDGLLQSCWLLESARATVLARWGADFEERAERTAKRAALVEDALRARAIEAPSAIVEPHTQWVASVVGETPESVALGPALLQRLGEWTNVYIVDYLPSDPATFLALGEAELLFPVAPRAIEEADALVASGAPGHGPRFVVLTDIHIGAKATPELTRRAVEEINALEPEFVVVPGDITDDGEPSQFADARAILSQLRSPFYAVLGNHDAVQRSTRRGDGASLFAQAFGTKPIDTVLECGVVQVALADTSDPTPSPFPDWDLGRGGFREDAGGTAGGALQPGQADTLAARLDPSRPVVLVQHHELQPFAGFPPVMFALREPDSSMLLDALSGFDLTVIAGHTHRSALTTVGNGVPQLEVPSLKDWPHCYTVVSVEGGRPRAVVRQLSDRELVWSRSKHLTRIYQNYVMGPLATLDHTFGA
jgi:predicted phosphodiesterase